MSLVPWNASWSAENKFEIRPCRFAGGRLAVWSPHLPGQGDPIFAKPHSVRQRRSIAEQRCTVCGEKVGKGYYDRWWFGIGSTDVAGAGFTTTEAPVHKACAEAALEVCPRLRAMGREPVPMPQWDGILSAVIGGEAVVRDYGLDVGARQVIGHMKLAWRRDPRPEGWL